MAINRPNTHGSVMVLVLCVMTVLLTFSTLLVRSCVQIFDLALKRGVYEQRVRSLADLAVYAQEITKIYLPVLSTLSTGTCIVHALPAWPLGMDTQYSGMITIEIQAKTIKVRSVLEGEGSVEEITKTYVRV